MTIVEDIVQWAATRTPWQQYVLSRAAESGRLSSSEYSSLTDLLINGLIPTSPQLRPENIPLSTPSHEKVTLIEIKDLDNVNALLTGQSLTFGEEGITVIYGDNGSGKSGYARLIKAMVAARHSASILPDVFSSRAAKEQGATIIYRKDSELVPAKWNEDGSIIPGVAFYDEHCGNAYIVSESEVTFRPAALTLLDELINGCDEIRYNLEQILEENALAQENIPSAPPGTRAETFIQNITSKTSDEDIESECTVPEDVLEMLAALRIEEARLRSSNPTSEKQRLERQMKAYTRLVQLFQNIEGALSRNNLERIDVLTSELEIALEASKLASVERFAKEPLQDVGSSAWRDLWEAARHYASQIQEDGSPTGVNGRCVLCQQELDSIAIQRLENFEEFVKQDIARRVDQLGQSHATLVMDLRSVLQNFDDIDLIIETLDEDPSGLLSQVRTAVEDLKVNLKKVLATLETRSIVVEFSLTTQITPLLKARFDLLETESATIDIGRFSQSLNRLQSDIREIEGSIILADAKQIIINERDRLLERAQLEALKDTTDTRGISRKAADLIREHVTEQIRDQFTREADRLRLERVTLRDAGGRKGTLQHVPGLLGVSQQVELTQVLSEGEQTALGLAGFFTEVFFDTSQSTIVLDDPVSSLDHIRRGKVADRLVQIALNRQVIVFTHDVSFVAELRSFSEREGIQFTERSVERLISGSPGVCLDIHPWKAKDAAQRIQSLSEDLARIKRDSKGWDQATYERKTSEWAGKLSETWERIISLDVVGQVVERGTMEVRPRMIRVLAQLTAADDQDFQTGYSACSRWARRHDKSVDLNFVSPTTDEMHAELERARVWLQRVKSYRN